MSRFTLILYVPSTAYSTIPLWINDDGGRGDTNVNLAYSLVRPVTGATMHIVELEFNWYQGWYVDRVKSLPYRPPWTLITAGSPPFPIYAFRGLSTTFQTNAVDNVTLLSAKQKAIANNYGMAYYVGGSTRYAGGLCISVAAGGLSGIFYRDANGNGGNTFWGSSDNSVAAQTAITLATLNSGSTTQFIALHEFMHQMDLFLPKYDGGSGLLSDNATFIGLYSTYLFGNGKYSGTNTREAFAEAGAAYIWYKSQGDMKFLNYVFASNSTAITAYLNFMDAHNAWV